MIIEESKKEILKFLADYPNPKIITATTIKDGCVSIIRPIKTICGAELICSPETRSCLLDLINNGSVNRTG